MIEKFSEATRIAVVAVDFKGEPITGYFGFTDYCLELRKNKACLNTCFRSDAHGGVESARSGKPSIYTCYSGLVDFAVPIIFDGQFLGSILAGQVKMEKKVYPVAMETKDPEVLQVLNCPKLREMYEKVPTVNSKELEAAADLLQLIATYIVTQGFNKRVQDELNEKNTKLISEMEVRVALEKNLRESELKLLQSQVNPHFLFNVLNTINSLAMIENAPKTSEMVYSLSDMLRYTIKNKMHNLVSLEQELDYTQKYLNIQQTRLNDRIKFEIDVPEKYSSVKIPFMIIQPTVSNAINHGLFNKSDNAVLKICAREDKNNVYLDVEDNGIGMKAETIRKIKEGAYEGNGQGSTGIGLMNADKRLVHRFGNQYRLGIESTIGKGTKITIKLPK